MDFRAHVEHSDLSVFPARASAHLRWTRRDSCWCFTLALECPPRCISKSSRSDRARVSYPLYMLAQNSSLTQNLFSSDPPVSLCGQELSGMLSCWAATHDYNSTSGCAEHAKALFECMRTAVRVNYYKLCQCANLVMCGHSQ